MGSLSNELAEGSDSRGITAHPPCCPGTPKDLKDHLRDVRKRHPPPSLLSSFGMWWSQRREGKDERKGQERIKAGD